MIQIIIQLVALGVAIAFLRKVIVSLFKTNKVYLAGVVLTGLVWAGAWTWGLIESQKDVNGFSVGIAVWLAYTLFLIVLLAPAVAANTKNL